MQRESPDFKEEQAKKSRLRRKKESTPRRSWLKKTIAGALALVGGIAYLRFESNWLETTQKTVALPTLPKGRKIRILHLSDFHFSKTVSIKDIDLALQKGLERKPNLMMITGDFITDELTPENSGKLADCLREYTRQVSTFACLGNHDGGTWSKKEAATQAPNVSKACSRRQTPICSKTVPSVFHSRDKRSSLAESETIGRKPVDRRVCSALFRTRSGLPRNDHSSLSQSGCQATAEELSMGPHAQRPYPRRADEDPVPRLCPLRSGHGSLDDRRPA